jgi:hypothetical protein
MSDRYFHSLFLFYELLNAGAVFPQNIIYPLSIITVSEQMYHWFPSIWQDQYPTVVMVTQNLHPID